MNRLFTRRRKRRRLLALMARCPSDGIASWRTMERRLYAMEALGIPTEFHVYKGLGHGFGIGTGTVAEGWVADAIAFWEERENNESYNGKFHKVKV